MMAGPGSTGAQAIVGSGFSRTRSSAVEFAALRQSWRPALAGPDRPRVGFAALRQSWGPALAGPDRPRVGFVALRQSWGPALAGPSESIDGGFALSPAIMHLQSVQDLL